LDFKVTQHIRPCILRISAPIVFVLMGAIAPAHTAPISSPYNAHMKTSSGAAASTHKPLILSSEALRKDVEAFNAQDEELYPDSIDNAHAWAFLNGNVPLFDCPDTSMRQIYNFRWWTYRKHLRKSPSGWIVTEFLPNVPWAGKYNSIDCAAAHHIMEGRWLADPQYMNDYSAFWFAPDGGEPRRYSFWAASSIYQRAIVSGDRTQAIHLLDDLRANSMEWEKSHRDANGLYQQSDDRDGMEVSIGGSGYRATINSYMCGDAMAISKIAEWTGKNDLAIEYRRKAEAIKRAMLSKLWDPKAQFFKVLPAGDNTSLADVREQHGYTPWYFELPPDTAEYSKAWSQVMAPQGFYAPYGPTTAERRSPSFALSYQGHECQWNGPSWPFATSITLTGMANLLNDYHQDIVSKADYFKLLSNYARSQYLKHDDGRVTPWIDEDLNPDTGDWIARTVQKDGGHWSPRERGKDYNHSTFCDLIITGLIGLRPRMDNELEVNPLVPAGAWEYFCLDAVPYHGQAITILWDKSGRHYEHGKGLSLFADGKQIAHRKDLGKLEATLPAIGAHS